MMMYHLGLAELYIYCVLVLLCKFGKQVGEAEVLKGKGFVIQPCFRLAGTGSYGLHTNL